MTPSFRACEACSERSEAEYISENPQDSEIRRDSMVFPLTAGCVINRSETRREYISPKRGLPNGAHVGLAPPSMAATVSERLMTQPALTLEWFAHLITYAFPRCVVGIWRPIPLGNLQPRPRAPSAFDDLWERRFRGVSVDEYRSGNDFAYHGGLPPLRDRIQTAAISRCPADEESGNAGKPY